MGLLRAVVLLALVVGSAACGDDGDNVAGATPRPDQPVSAPAQRSSTPPADPAACRRVSRRLRGRTLWRADASARQAGCALRVVVRNGIDLPVTEDLSRTRINVATKDGRIVKVVGLF